MSAPVDAPPVLSRRGRYGVLATLYVTQFVGIGFLTTGLVGILRDGGTSLSTLALVQLLGLVWPVKFLWAPLVDSRGSHRRGHYRSWLLALQAAMVASLLALLPFSDPSAWIGPVLVICAAYVICSATQDIAADAVAVRLLDPGERGTGNGIQVGAAYAGNVLGGGACVVVYDRAGWVPAILLLAALTAVALVVVWWFREPPRLAPAPPAREAYRSLLSVFARPGCRRWTFGVVPLVYAAAAGAYGLVSPALVDAGWSLTRVGTVLGVVASIPALAAGLVAGLLIGRWGRAGVLAAGSAVLLVSVLLLVPVLGGQAPLAATTAVVCLFMAAYTVVNVVVYTVNMDHARPGTAGSDVTVLTSFAMISSFIASAVALAVADRVGYPAVAWGTAALAALAGVAGVRHLQRFDAREGEPLSVPGAWMKV